MTKKISMVIALAVAAAIFTLTQSPRTGNDFPTAILLVTLDTTRADHLGSYGYQRSTSPMLDALATEGARAEVAISPMPTTGPAHVSILTVLYPRSHGVLRNGVKLRDGIPTLASWAKSKGYRTAAFVSRNHVSPEALNLHGFDTAHDEGVKYKNGQVALDKALDWLDTNGGQPFFLWVHFFDPHRPYEPPGGFAEPFLSELFESGPFKGEQIANYDGEIAYMDTLVGKLVNRVREQGGSGEAPLIVVAADHGEAMTELYDRFNFKFDHGKHLYQGIVRVPLLVVWPGKVPAGTVIREPVTLADIPATIFDLLETEGFENQGTSFAPLFQAHSGSPRHAVVERRFLGGKDDFAKQKDSGQQYAIQDDRYQLIVTLPENDMELLELDDDPGTQPNRADELPEVRARLRRVLDDWMARVQLSEALDLKIEEERVKDLKALGYL